MRLLAWNIRQGGGKRLPAIARALAEHDADVLVLSEYRGGDSAMRLRAALHAIGYAHVSAALPTGGGNGVLIAARTPFDEDAAISPALPEPCRIVRAYFGALCVYGVYMPNLLKKVPYWQALIAALAAESLGAESVALGDFNTCRAFVDEPGAIDLTAHFLDEIERVGCCDLWRRRHPEGREFSWYSTAATASASTTPSCHPPWPAAPAPCATRTSSARTVSPTIRSCSSTSINNPHPDPFPASGGGIGWGSRCPAYDFGGGGPARARSCSSPSLAAIATL